ncbi:flagellar protein FlhE [Kosakonia sp. YIM B13605]|jgi:flagellar protein FlhE|uniref:flagellar protein FlhE n=1 Tax=Kosakonia TaxID=1330547 RepID=UPI0028AD0185|nr:flagellar protein FlhE [Kosakonia sacchari]
MKRKSILLALSGLMFISSSAFATGGTATSSMVPPSISVKNQWYNKAFSVPAGTPSTGKVGQVYYTWTYSSYPAGMQVYLCYNNGNTCYDVSSARSGSVDFTKDNIAPNQPISLWARVNGTGKMVTVNGQSSQVIVNYTF